MEDAALQGGRMKSILDPSFRYRSSAQTDLKQTFARIRRELSKTQQADEPSYSRTTKTAEKRFVKTDT